MTSSNQNKNGCFPGSASLFRKADLAQTRPFSFQWFQGLLYSEDVFVNMQEDTLCHPSSANTSMSYPPLIGAPVYSRSHLSLHSDVTKTLTAYQKDLNYAMLRRINNRLAPFVAAINAALHGTTSMTDKQIIHFTQQERQGPFTTTLTVILETLYTWQASS